MNNIIHAVGVCIVKDGKVLLVKHTESAGHLTGVYGIPSGRVDAGETERQAAVRELFEETGLLAMEEDLIEYPSNVYSAEVERKGSKTERFHYKAFICRRFSGELKDSEETIPEWVEIKDIDALPLLPNVKEIIENEMKW